MGWTETIRSDIGMEIQNITYIDRTMNSIRTARIPFLLARNRMTPVKTRVIAMKKRMSMMFPEDEDV